MGLDPILALMPDGPDRQLALMNAERGPGLAELNVSAPQLWSYPVSLDGVGLAVRLSVG